MTSVSRGARSAFGHLAATFRSPRRDYPLHAATYTRYPTHYSHHNPRLSTSLFIMVGVPIRRVPPSPPINKSPPNSRKIPPTPTSTSRPPAMPTSSKNSTALHTSPKNSYTSHRSTSRQIRKTKMM